MPGPKEEFSLAMRTQWRKLVALLAAAAVLAGCGGGSAGGEQGGELIVYSGRAEFLIQPVLDAFEKETGVRITLRSGSASEMANQIGEERTNPQADVFIANDAGTMEVLHQAGLLAPHLSDAIRQVPEQYRAPDGAWTAVGLRGRVIMYNTTLVQPAELPGSIFDLADPKWKGKFAMAKSVNESLIGSITAMRLTYGDARTEEFLRALLANDPATFKSHTQVRQAVGRGEYALGWVNHYYYHLEKKDGSPVGVVYPDQGEGQMGVPVNASAVAMVKGGPNPEQAARFVDFVLRKDIQELFTTVEYEIPVLPGVPVNGAKALGTFKVTPVQLIQYGQELDATVKLIIKVGMP